MPSERFYADTPLNTPEISIEGKELHHLISVMRARIGDSVEIVNGRGELANGMIKAIEKERAILAILSYQKEGKQPEIVLAQALPRMNHLEWIIEKGSELGASVFWLFPGEYSEKKTLSSQQTKRLDSLNVAAMKQCGRLFLPQILLKPSLSEWTLFPGSLFYGDIRKIAPRFPSLLKGAITIFIGPEKGFSSKEIKILEYTLKAQGIKLHDNILRAETAAIAALAQINVLVGLEKRF